MTGSLAVVAVVGVSCLGFALVACGHDVPAAPAAARARPGTVLHLTCDQNKTVAAAAAVAVQRDGLHVRTVNTSGLSGGYLNYGYVLAGGRTLGGGHPLRPGITEQVLQVPPGKVSLDCSYRLGTSRTAKVTVRLQDADHYFRPTTLAELGCSANGSPSWTIGEGHGKTPEAAVKALIAQWPSPQRLRARLAPIGYVSAATVTYLLDRDGRLWATATVAHDHGQFSAGMDLLC